MFPLKVLNRLRDGQDIAVEVTPTLLNHRAYIYVVPQVDPELATWDRASYRWLRVYVDENILAGFKVNYVQIKTELIDSFQAGFDIDVEPTSIERYFATDEKELVIVVSRWLTDLSGFRAPMGVALPTDFIL